LYIFDFELFLNLSLIRFFQFLSIFKRLSLSDLFFEKHIINFRILKKSPAFILLKNIASLEFKNRSKKNESFNK
jgi:hypothetical protein